MSDKVMTCTGALDSSNRINVRGSYAASPGPVWGWRIGIEFGTGSMRVVMHNIWPEGKEELAVEMDYGHA